MKIKTDFVTNWISGSSLTIAFDLKHGTKKEVSIFDGSCEFDYNLVVKNGRLNALPLPYGEEKSIPVRDYDSLFVMILNSFAWQMSGEADKEFINLYYRYRINEISSKTFLKEVAELGEFDELDIDPEEFDDPKELDYEIRERVNDLLGEYNACSSKDFEDLLELFQKVRADISDLSDINGLTITCKDTSCGESLEMVVDKYYLPKKFVQVSEDDPNFESKLDYWVEHLKDVVSYNGYTLEEFYAGSDKPMDKESLDKLWRDMVRRSLLSGDLNDMNLDEDISPESFTTTNVQHFELQGIEPQAESKT